jgi:hypothetical protein
LSVFGILDSDPINVTVVIYVLPELEDKKVLNSVKKESKLGFILVTDQNPAGNLLF